MRISIVVLSILVTLLIVHSIALTNRVAEHQQTIGYMIQSQKYLLDAFGQVIQSQKRATVLKEG